jgi:hypothetical protein
VGGVSGGVMGLVAVVVNPDSIIMSLSCELRTGGADGGGGGGISSALGNVGEPDDVGVMRFGGGKTCRLCVNMDTGLEEGE